jgi:DNA-binding SARP family transcriptional activator/ABC-type branched-subunit amino acid transport system substrate-binding protein/DNA-binding beta-propeller fold protein YncE
VESPSFAILGPLEASVSGVPVAIGGRRQQVLLAVLLDHRNTVVSRDRLIDEVWDGEPPDSVHAALQNAVSQLRRVLEPGRDAGAASHVLETRGTGYLLHVVPAALDLDRVLDRQARARAVAETDPAEAVALLRAALAEWRGEPLADVAAEAARAFAARLAPLRIDVEEELLELEVASGRHREALPRLQELVAAEPLRARLRGALMLALYRSGRQTEALAAYREGARAFAEVGLDPDVELQRLERAMLDHDPALDRAAPAVRPALSHRRRWLLALAGTAAVAAGAIGAVLIAGRDDAPSAAAPRADGDRLVGLDARTGRILAQYPVGGTPTSVATTDGAAWVLNADDATISRIDLRSGAAQTFGSGAVPIDVAAGGGTLWVANGRRTDAQFVGPVGSEVSRVDPVTRAVLLTTSLPRRRDLTSNLAVGRLAVTDRAVWAVSSDDRVIRLDPASGRILDEISDVTAHAIAVGGSGVWVVENSGVARLDPTGGTVAEHIAVPLVEPEAMAADADSLWIADSATGILWRLRRGAADPVPIPLDAGIGAIAATPAAVWVANAREGTLTRVDPATNAVAGRVRVQGAPRGLAAAGGRVWATVAGAPRTVGVLPASTCGELITDGAAPPDVVLVTDAPMRAGARLPTLQVRDAALQTIRAAGFRAGRFRVGFAACDDSTAQSAIYDPDKCAANARLYVASPAVVGEIGPFNSGCAAAQLPIANAAADGPLAMVSPTASVVDLTRAPPGSAGAARLYPAGVRSFARLFPRDDLQGVALARYARDRGARRVAVVLGDYGADQAQAFARTADDLGLRVAGVVRAPRDGGETAAARVARLHPDAVLVASLIDDNGGELVRALRRRLPSDVLLLGVDGLLPVSALWAHAGSAARGVVLADPGAVVERLPAAGQRFADAFAAAHGGQPAEPAAIAAAAATEVLLDAIRRSDGTRAGVTRALLATRVDGVLGPIGFDANGDVVPATVTLVRVERGGGADIAGSMDGARVERVVTIGPE